MKVRTKNISYFKRDIHKMGSNFKRLLAETDLNEDSIDKELFSLFGKIKDLKKKGKDKEKGGEYDKALKRLSHLAKNRLKFKGINR